MMSDQSGTLQLNDVSVEFNEKGRTVKAVQHVDVTVPHGSIFGLIGYSGAGKSTLARTINLLQQPTAGKVIYDNTDVTSLKGAELRNWRRKIGMIFQHFNLMATRTAEDNVMLALLHSKLSKKEKQAKVLRLLKLVGLEDKKDAYPSQLSGGQKQRVAIARALANDPQILISDEATSALDPKTTRNILHLLKQLNDQLGVTIILITHEMEVVKEISNQVAVMDHGKIIEQGSTTQLFVQPQQELTRELLVNGDQDEDKVASLVKQYSAAGQCLISFTYRAQQTDLYSLLKLIEAKIEKLKLVYTTSQVVKNHLWGTSIVAVDKNKSQQLLQQMDSHPAIVHSTALREAE